MAINRKIIIKLLNMSFSENDNEALVAIRKANWLLKKEKILWGSVLDASAESARNYYSPRYEYAFRMDKEIVDRFLKDDISVTEWEHGFINDMNAAFKKWGRLTPKQSAVLKKIHDKSYRRSG